MRENEVPINDLFNRSALCILESEMNALVRTEKDIRSILMRLCIVALAGTETCVNLIYSLGIFEAKDSWSSLRQSEKLRIWSCCFCPWSDWMARSLAMILESVKYAYGAND